MVSDIITPGETPPGSHGLTDVAGCISVIFQKNQKSVFTLFSGGQGTPLNYTFDLFED